MPLLEILQPKKDSTPEFEQTEAELLEKTDEKPQTEKPILHDDNRNGSVRLFWQPFTGNYFPLEDFIQTQMDNRETSQWMMYIHVGDS